MQRDLLEQYCLKMPKSLWEEVDRQRMSLVGITNPTGITRAAYLRDAVTAYNRYMHEVVSPKVSAMKEDLDEPCSFFWNDGQDVSF
jgi:hypothetical protein